MKVCANCREWVCKVHLQRHSLECRGPTLTITATARGSGAAGDAVDAVTDGEGGGAEQEESDRHVWRVNSTEAAGSAGSDRISYLEAAREG